VTGANSGLGFHTSQKLAELGAKVFMVCRDQERGEQAKSKIKGDVTLLRCDMASYDSIMALDLPEVDVLIHNAGAMFNERDTVNWPIGPIDHTLALHVAGPLLLSSRFKPENTIWISSGGMYTQKLKVESLFQPPEPFDGMV
jgi:NAD(P)-dependent dehydrogenase (short-subunit alcohol dehydrogenase family)